MSTSSFKLSKEQVDEFEAKGYVMVESLLTQEELDILEAGRQAIDTHKPSSSFQHKTRTDE